MNSLSFATTPVPPTYPPGGAYTNRPDGYSFDVSGNMLNDGANNLTYDAENCLISAGTTTYTCDSHGIRVQKALQGGPITVYIFSGGKDIAEYDYTSGSPSPGSPSREYLYLGGQLAATMQGTTVTYHHGDHLSVRLSTGGLSSSPNYGQTVGEQGTYPYGEQWYATNTTTKFFFTSYERDPETGNDYAMARYYINRYGRFSCVDPVLGHTGDPQSWNRYAYVRNNPINLTDPTGMNWFVNFLKVLVSMVLNLFTAGHYFPQGTGTPPIFDGGPLSDSTATLNSIYHPVDPGLFGINNFMLSPTTVNTAWIDDCADSLFGVGLVAFTPAKGKFDEGGPQNGSFTGVKAGIPTGPGGTGPGVLGNYPDAVGPYQFTVTTDTSMSENEVDSKWRAMTSSRGGKLPPADYKAPGFTDETAPYTNFVSNDYGVIPWQTQIWELGNSLGAITGRGNRWNGEFGYDKTNENGKMMWQCYFLHSQLYLH